jgi:peptide/nickel transport system substrate-binding protein
MVQSDRLYERINRLDANFQNSSRTARTQPTTLAAGQNGYPGDEGDWLVWRIGAEPATLNLLVGKDIYVDWITGGNIFEMLLEYDFDEARLKPKLAESYHVSDDGLEITIRLRDDIHFSDGRPVTADDVVFTYNTLINPGIDAASLANYYRDVKEVTKVNEREIKFIMHRVYFKGLEIVGLLPILPKHIYEFTDPADFNKHLSSPVGSGPYVFEKWEVGRQIVLRKNRNYWGQQPKLDRLVFRVITNDVAALQALRSHEIDLMVPTSEQYAELTKNEEFQSNFHCLAYWNPGTGYSYIGWNQNTPFFKDRRVRLAMTHLVDRESINEHILKGQARIVTGPFYVLGKQNNPNIKPWPFDPERAKQLLDEAGWKDTDSDGVRDRDGVPFKFRFMIVSGSQTSEQIAKLLKDEMAKVGIEMTADPYEWSVFGERLHNRDFEAVTLGWGGGAGEEGDPYQIWHSSQIAGKGSNYVGFGNSEADKLMEEARKTLDEQKRNELYHRFHEILHEEQPYTFLFTASSKRFVDKRFHNIKIHKLGLDPLEWYVPKELQRYE